jgi:hypothetical protein
MSAEAMNTDLSEKDESLWVLVASPAIWALHFLLSYGTAAIWCAKFAGPDGSLGVVRVAIAAYTVVALGAIGVIGRRGYERHRFGDSTLPHDFDSPADRHRFLGFTVLILSGLSAIAVVYAALPAVFIGSCH